MVGFARVRMRMTLPSIFAEVSVPPKRFSVGAEMRATTRSPCMAVEVFSDRISRSLAAGVSLRT